MNKLIDINLLKSFFNLCKSYHFEDKYKHLPDSGSGMAKVLSVDELDRPQWVRMDDMLNRLDYKDEESENANEENIKQNSYGVRFKYSDMSGIERIGNLDLHRTCPIQNGFKGCIEQNGAIQYYLDENDWSKKADGTPSRLDGYDGNVSIDTFNDFYINFTIKDTWAEVRISYKKLGKDWIKVDRLLIHAFRSTRLTSVPKDMGWLSTLTTNSMVSVVNDNIRGGDGSVAYDSNSVFSSTKNKPTTSISRQSAREYFRLNGYENINFYQYIYIFYWLYVIEYCNFNSQDEIMTDDPLLKYKRGGLGPSVTTLSDTEWSRFNGYRPIVPNGYFADCGNKTAFKTFNINITLADGTIVNKQIQTHSWHGFQNIFGDIWTNVDGATIIKEQVDGKWKTIWQFMKNPAKYVDIKSEIPDREIETSIVTSGWPYQIFFTDFGEIVPIRLGATSVTGTCDYHYWSQNTPACLLVGGRGYSGTYAGLGYLHISNSVDLSSIRVGFRGVISPTQEAAA